MSLQSRTIRSSHLFFHKSEKKISEILSAKDSFI